jgi:DNA helicase MCM8
MTESLYDKCVDEHGVVDFARSGGMSNQKQSKKFLRALNEQCDLQKKDCFSMNEMYNLADRISLQVANLDAIVESLNNAGYITKKGSSMYQVSSCFQ